MIITRRTLFGFLAAPAIIRVADLMPVRSVILPPPLIARVGFTAKELALISSAAIVIYGRNRVWSQAQAESWARIDPAIRASIRG